MVATITESFVNKNFGHFTDAQLPDCSWLDLRAGNGSLELDITVLGKCVTHGGVLVAKDPVMQYKKMQTPGVL